MPQNSGQQRELLSDLTPVQRALFEHLLSHFCASIQYQHKRNGEGSRLRGWQELLLRKSRFHPNKQLLRYHQLIP